MKKLILRHIPQNPTLELAEELVEKYRNKSYQEIVSIGGGSTIDVGKYIAWKLKLPHTAIPTTAGTGSEVTKYVVLTVGGKKKTFSNKEFIPKKFILDPKLVVSLPRQYTISSGLDALSQAIESKTVFSEAVIRLVFDNLYKSVCFPENEKYRFNMLLAANLSGQSINISPTGFCHGISYSLTERYGIPHGLACAMTLPYFAPDLPIEKLLKKLGVDRKKVLKKIDTQLVVEDSLKQKKLTGYSADDIMRALL